MDEQKYLEYIVNRGLTFGSKRPHFLIEYYKELELSSQLILKIQEAIANKSNFEIVISEFSELKKVLDKKIEKLLKHPDFNPFKEELRRNYPEQFSSYPFKYNNVTYYLYPKLENSEIDGKIMDINSFIDILNHHQKVNIPLKFLYES